MTKFLRTMGLVRLSHPLMEAETNGGENEGRDLKYNVLCYGTVGGIGAKRYSKRC